MAIFLISSPVEPTRNNRKIIPIAVMGGSDSKSLSEFMRVCNSSDDSWEACIKHFGVAPSGNPEVQAPRSFFSVDFDKYSIVCIFHGDKCIDGTAIYIYDISIESDTAEIKYFVGYKQSENLDDVHKTCPYAIAIVPKLTASKYIFYLGTRSNLGDEHIFTKKNSWPQ